MRKSKSIVGLGFLGLLFAACLILGFSGLLNSKVTRNMLLIFLYITLGEMWNLLSGFSGMTSLGLQAFIGLSGYTVAMVTTEYKLNFVIGILIGIAISLLFGFLQSLLLLRMNGMYFAIATWVCAEALGTFFTSWDYVHQGAGMTITIKPYPKAGELYFAALILCVVAIVAIYLLMKTKPGFGLAAMSDDIQTAASLGVNVGRHKLTAYLIAAFFTSIAGSLFYINNLTIRPEAGFGVSWTISMVFIVIIGGVGTIEGPVIGAIIYVLLTGFLDQFKAWSNIILGLICILMILFMPKGIAGLMRRLLRTKWMQRLIGWLSGLFGKLPFFRKKTAV